MSNFKKASKLKLRFNTTKGPLSAEQLWDLTQTALETSVRAQKKILKKTDDDDLGFLDVSTITNPVEQLRFDILKEVYLEKKAERAAKITAKEAREHNDTIHALIAAKKAEALGNKSVDELEKLLVKED